MCKLQDKLEEIAKIIAQKGHESMKGYNRCSEI